MADTYKIIRFYRNGRKTTVRRGVSRETAERHCSREDTKRVNKKTGDIIWMDGFTKE